MMASFVHLIHSVDSVSLLAEIDKQAEKVARKIQCLLQVHIAKEETKFGFSPDELLEAFQQHVFDKFSHVQIVGLMGMATFTPDHDQVRSEFRTLRKLFDTLKVAALPANTTMKELSMGMSGDYQIAMEEGSTLIRVGSAIFGSR
jgi:pyridoxal phosphate enzyme (YggS family)